MSRIFLSHSSKDDFPAVAIADWLKENGWEDVFLDLDATQGIHPGERWERALHVHAGRCEAVLFLVSRNWLSSDWCRREYELARRLNKRIFVVLIDDSAIADLPPYLTQHQAVSLAAGKDHQLFRVTRPGTQDEGHVSFSREGLARLKGGLTQSGLDPRFFAWPPPNDPKRAPYRGLEPLEDADAGIFFGRDGPVIEALDALRGLREAACPRLFVILGASGAGKSSFLRAGLLPRLARDDRTFLPLAPMRPERAAVTGVNGLVAAIAAACAEKALPITRAQLREAAAAGGASLRPYLRRLVARAETSAESPTPPTLVIAIDQAEEMFRAEGAQEGELLLRLVSELTAVDDPPIIAVFAIRSDSYDALEHAKPLEGLSQKAFPLLPMPRGAYQIVIEGPARRLAESGRKFEIDPSLTQALLEDLEKGGGSDALPLLAFTLEQLFSDYASAGRLSRAEYDRFGGLKGAIDAATARVFREADKDPRIPKDQAARLALLRRGLIPWLAGIDPETKTPRRRRAPAAQIPDEARPLIELLVEQRLLTRAVDEQTRTVTLEPAHEALLRQWGNLKGWLEEDFARLVALEGVKRAARDWDANARNAAWAAHSGARLEEASRLDNRPDLAALLDATDRAYLAACQDKQTEAQGRELALAAAERRAAQRTRLGLVVSSVLLVLALAAAVLAWRNAGEAKSETLQAQQRSAVLAANVSESIIEAGAIDQALLLMLDAAKVFDDASVPDQIRIAFTKALENRERIDTKTLAPNIQTFDTPGASLLFDPASKDIWKLTNAINPTRLVAGAPNDGAVLNLRQSANGKDYIVVRDTLDVERLDMTSGARTKIGTLPQPPEAAGRTYDLDNTEIADDDLVIRDFFITDAAAKPNATPSRYFQAFDSASGKLIAGALSGIDAILRKSPSGGLYGVDDNNKLFAVTAGAGGILIAQPANLTGANAVNARFGRCVASAPSAAQAAMIKELNDQATGLGNYFTCRQVGAGYLLEEVSTGSAGEARYDFLFRANGHKVDINDVLASALPRQLSGNNSAWVGAYPTAPPPAGAAKAAGKDLLGVLVNRNAYVLSHDSDEDDHTTGKERWSVALNYRHPTFVNSGRFVDADHLIAVENESGRIVEHDFGDPPSRNYFTSASAGIVGSDTPVATLHRGTCVGYAIPRSKKATLPDGRQIVLNTSSPSESSDKHEIDIAGPPQTAIALGDSTTCVEFSADWTRMLAVTNGGITIYDFTKVLRTGTLAGNDVGTINAGNVIAAFFYGPSNGKVVATNLTNHVQLWSPDAEQKTWTVSNLYEGDSPLIYAEPDATGGRLILLVNDGGGDVHGVLYSLDAREIWLDLGNDYKWLGAAFTDKSEIAVSQHWKWTNVFPLPSLTALSAIADGALSPQCRPPTPKDYRASLCWPAANQ